MEDQNSTVQQRGGGMEEEADVLDAIFAEPEKAEGPFAEQLEPPKEELPQETLQECPMDAEPAASHPEEEELRDAAAAPEVVAQEAEEELPKTETASKERQADAVEKKSRGKPKDPLAPPKPKNGYSQFTSEMRPKLKEQNPALAADLKAMGTALADEWAKVPQEEKDRLDEQYQKEMVIWKPKMEEYMKTESYKDFFDRKQDWLGVKKQKKLKKTMASDAPKKPKSGYMIFASEVREEVQKEVLAEGLGMGEIGKRIAERWKALSEVEQAKYAAMSEQQKLDYDVSFAEYCKTESYSKYMDARAKLDGGLKLSKLKRTSLRNAPKPAKSAKVLWQKEHMREIVEAVKRESEDGKAKTGPLAKKLSQSWAALPSQEKKVYEEKAEQLKDEFAKQLKEFKVQKKYSDFLIERQRVRLWQARQEHLRNAPRRPKGVFALFREDHKDLGAVPSAETVETTSGKGKGKGKAAAAVKQLYDAATEEEKQEYAKKAEDVKKEYEEKKAEFEKSERFLEYKKQEKSIEREMKNEAVKVTTLRFLRAAPDPVPSTGLQLFIASAQREKRKAEQNAIEQPKEKRAKTEEVTALKAEFTKLEKDVKQEYEAKAAEQKKEYEANVKRFMETDTWKEYVKEARRFKIQPRALLADKKNIIKRLKGGAKEKTPAVMFPLPPRPPEYPDKAHTAMHYFTLEEKERRQEEGGADLQQLSKKYQELGDEDRKKYMAMANEDARRNLEEMKAFRLSVVGKAYLSQVKNVNKRRTLFAARSKYLKGQPKLTGITPFSIFQRERKDDVLAKHPDCKDKGEQTRLLTTAFNELSEEEKQAFIERSKQHHNDQKAAMDEFKQTENYKLYTKVTERFSRKKAAPKASPKSAAAKLPDGMPKKPPMHARNIWMTEMKAEGKSSQLKEMLLQWQGLEEHVKKGYEEKLKVLRQEYDQSMNDFGKTLEAKKYYREQKAAQKKAALQRAKDRLNAAKDKDGNKLEEPKKPKTAYQLFMAEKRSEVKGGLVEQSKQLAAMWEKVDVDAKANYEEEAKKLKKDYDEAMAEYKKNPAYKAFVREREKINGKTTATPGAAGRGAAKKQPKAKAVKARGKAKAKAKARGRKDDSEDDAMGSDSDTGSASSSSSSSSSD
mmetsp:Transcript_34778/g.79742  ORF Transcript_34778/g.79742 Transcript_34778/m.79742 type:complete len:1127 (+) Transcript_34778:19-3399(+)